MAIHPQFKAALELLDSGAVDDLRELLRNHVDLVDARDEDNASLLIRLIDWPGYRPNSAECARALLEAGADVDARRDDENGTALAGALCTKEVDVIRVLLEFGADIHAPLGWMAGTNLELADRTCQDLGRQRDDEIVALSEIFSKAAPRTIPSRPPFGGTTPLLFVSDVAESEKFYTEKLGFHVDWRVEEDDCNPYICISRGGTEFHLTGCQCEDKRHIGNLWVRVECDLIDRQFEECRAAGVNIFDEPANRPWGFREFRTEDPDGNRLTFYGPTTDDE